MLIIKAWSIMGEVHIEAEIDMGPRHHSSKVRWQDSLASSDPLEKLCKAITNALVALDGVAGEVGSELGFDRGAL